MFTIGLLMFAFSLCYLKWVSDPYKGRADVLDITAVGGFLLGIGLMIGKVAFLIWAFESKIGYLH